MRLLYQLLDVCLIVFYKHCLQHYKECVLLNALFSRQFDQRKSKSKRFFAGSKKPENSQNIGISYNLFHF